MSEITGATVATTHQDDTCAVKEASWLNQWENAFGGNQGEQRRRPHQQRRRHHHRRRRRRLQLLLPRRLCLRPMLHPVLRPMLRAPPLLLLLPRPTLQLRRPLARLHCLARQR
jgi:hypothetical protein